MGSLLMLRLLRSWRRSPKIIMLRAQGSQILGETLLYYNPHTTQPQMRFEKKWLELELSLGWC